MIGVRSAGCSQTKNLPYLYFHQCHWQLDAAMPKAECSIQKRQGNYASTLPLPLPDKIAPEKPDSHLERLRMWKEARAREQKESCTRVKVPEHKIVEELQRLLRVLRKRMHACRRELLDRLETLRERDGDSVHASDPGNSMRTADDLEEEENLWESLGSDWQSCVGYL